MEFEERRWTLYSKTSAAFASLAIFCTILFLNCSWLLTLSPHQPDLLGAAAAFGNIDSTAVHANPNPMARIRPTSSGKCDLSQGEWVPDMGPLPYTSDTCRHLQHSRQNCVRNGRPDSGYLHWRWKPSDCELPPFNPTHFLERMRGKKLALIGDSLARNHLESLLCSLSQVEDPLRLYLNPDRSNELFWHFPSYNFTFRNFWSPFLVNYTEEHDIFKLYLDVPDMAWARQLGEYDIAVVSTAYWYYRKSLYHVDNTMLGANPHAELNVTTMEILSAMRIALTNVLKHMTMEYKGIIMLRTVTVDHFENGGWFNGGSCKKTRPFSHQDVSLDGMNREIFKVQVEEFQKAMAYVNDTSKLKLLNVTYSASLRPDGHPGSYRIIHFDNDPLYDCLHWCLPGPIDLWNQFLLHSIAADF